MFPDGTCIINSGLMENTPVHEKIIAVVAHEIAHYVLTRIAGEIVHEC